MMNYLHAFSESPCPPPGIMYSQHYLIITHLLKSNGASETSMESAQANLPVPQPLSRRHTQTKLRMDAAVVTHQTGLVQ